MAELSTEPTPPPPVAPPTRRPPAASRPRRPRAAATSAAGDSCGCSAGASAGHPRERARALRRRRPHGHRAVRIAVLLRLDHARRSRRDRSVRRRPSTTARRPRARPTPRWAHRSAAACRPRSPTCTRARPCSTSAPAPAPTSSSAPGASRPSGRAIGLDMTDEMLALARANAAEAGVENVEFVKGYLEDIPLPDASVDVVISNCVINLAADKRVVLAEAARVLRPGGRFAVSDVIADDDMDDATRADMAAVDRLHRRRAHRGRVPRRARRRRPHRRRDPPDAPRPRARGLGDHPRPQALTIDRPNRDDPGSAFGPLSALKQGQIGLKADPERLTDLAIVFGRFAGDSSILADPAEPLAMQKVESSPAGRLGFRERAGRSVGYNPSMTSTGAVQADLPLTTAQELPGARIAENLGLGFGPIVRSMGFARASLPGSRRCGRARSASTPRCWRTRAVTRSTG